MGNKAITKPSFKKRRLHQHRKSKLPLLQIEIGGNTLQHLFNRALEEMAQIIKPGACSAACHSDCIVNLELTANNPEGLLISLLNEVLKINTLYNSIFYYINIKEINSNRLIGQLFGIWYDNVATRIQPVTSKDCNLIAKNGEWKCTLIFHRKIN